MRMTNEQKTGKMKIIACVVAISVVIIFLVVSLALGIHVSQTNDEVSISGGIFYSANIPYSEIKEIKLLETVDYGGRTNGASLFIYRVGNYRNSEYGSYKLFVKSNVEAYIELTYGNGETVVFNSSDEESTKEIYESLLSKIGK